MVTNIMAPSSEEHKLVYTLEILTRITILIISQLPSQVSVILVDF